MTGILSVLLVIVVACSSHVVQSVAVASGSTLLSQYPMVMAHDSMSGEIDEKRDKIVAKWSKTQSVGIVEQLKCGTRSFDYRPTLKDGKIYAHHGGVTIRVTMQETLQQVLDWANANPSDLIVLYISHEDGDGCQAAVENLLAQEKVYTIKDCSVLSNLTYNAAKSQAVKWGGEGRNGAVLALFDCTEENYDEKINCYGKDFVCYDSWPKNTSSIPMSHLSTHLQSVTSVDPSMAYGNKMWMAQAHWQSTAASVSLGTLHGSSLVLDETRSGVNRWIETELTQHAFAHLNFLELDEVCDNGQNVYKALQTYYIQ